MKRLTQHGPLQRSRTFSGPTRRAVGLIITGVLFIALITTIAGRSEFGLTAGFGPAFVQGAAQTTNGTNLTTTYSNDVTAGDLLVAVFRTPGGTAVSDQLNGAWTEATGNNLYSIWYLPNAKAGRTSVTVTATSGALRAGIAEYSGMAVSSVFDAGSCNIGWGTTMTTGNTAPIGTGELVFAGGGTLNTSINVSAGSSNGVTATLRDQATGAAGTIGDEDITQAAPGVQNASMTLSAAGTNGWNACVATFRSVLSPGPTPTPAPTFPPLSGGLLPGQQIWKNGVSSYLFGTNDTEEWQGNNVETNSTVQGYLKRGGLPLMRSFFFHNSLNGGHENTDADIQRRINAITNSGMNCLGVIPNILLQSAPAPGNSYTDLGWAEHLVSLLDGTHPGYQECDMYEIGNEPDLTPDASNYVTEWNAFVPALRAINPRAKFFGPASYTINYGYIQWFLQGTVASGVQPDGVTFHRYGCGGTDTNLCLQMAALYGDRVNTVRTIVVNTLHKNIPIGITEWNMDPGSNNVLAGNDQFMRDFTTTSLNSMIAAHLDFANQFDAMSFAGYGTLDMFNINTSQPKAQFWAMVGVLQQNGGPSTLPLPTLTPTPTPIATVTVTASPSPSPPPSPTVTMTPPPSPTPGSTLAQDTFQRPNQALWGTASDGHTWGGDANVQSVFSISNNTGQVSNSTTTYSAVLGPVATDAEVLFTGSMSSYSNTNLGAVLRWTDGNNWYKAYINGTTLVVQKKVNGATTIIGSAPFPATAGTSYALRFRVVGTTLYARVWQTGTTEPANWMIMVTDSSFSSGFCGLRMLAQNGATASYTSFLATAE